ncbi:hypothetical protein AAK912_04150 [Merdimmobilis hominis]|uniref:hypothetical protein n=1 Tax=Merdimmobilis hominis TaxID=2897707 RepID=UPI0035158A05
MVPKNQIEILRLSQVGEAPPRYAYQPVGKRWAEGELTGKTNLFSQVGIGLRGAQFRLHRAAGITLFDAVRWRGSHYFLTGIQQKSPAEAVLSAALAEPVPCTAWRPAGKHPGAYGSPDAFLEAVGFPGILVEKYQGYQRETPYGEVQATYVLVAPKAVELRLGDRVTTGEGRTGPEDQKGPAYGVRAVHALDPYKNEYELYRYEEV